MGTGGCCTRRQKGVLQSCLCALAVVGLGLGCYMYSLLNEHVRNSEVLSQKHKQQQESVSAQLQVVYEHRSRLERSLQKERGEHKKTKEDFLVYKLEAQEALNKEKQDSMNRYSALTSQHKIMKSQQDDVRKQLQDLQLQYSRLKLEHRKALEQHSQSQQQKQAEISHLQDSVSNLKEESKQLRRAHQQVHAQLLETEAQMEEFRQLKEALHKIPSLKKPGMNAAKFWEGNQALKGQPRSLGNSHWQVPAQKEPSARPPAGRVPEPGGGNAPGIPAGERRALWGPVRSGRDREESFDQAVRFTRTVNGLRPGPMETETAVEGVGETLDVGRPRARSLAGGGPGGEQPKPFIVNGPSHETPQPEKAKSWDQVINDVSQRGQAKQNPPDPERRRGQGHRDTQWENMLPSEDDEDLEIEDEFDEPDEKSLLRSFGSRKKSIVQEPLIPGAEQDPAQDPNNQGEDEFEEAEVQEPGFADKGALDSGNQHDLFLKQGPKGPDGAGRNGDEGMEDYRDEQEAGMEDHAGEVEDDTNLID